MKCPFASRTTRRGRFSNSEVRTLRNNDRLGKSDALNNRLLYCNIQFGCHRSQAPAPSRISTKVTASQGCLPEALKGHKMIKNKISSLRGKSIPPKMFSAKILARSQVTIRSAGRYNSALRSQVTPSAELNIAVQYIQNTTSHVGFSYRQSVYKRLYYNYPTFSQTPSSPQYRS
jgi:hypothetical protein